MTARHAGGFGGFAVFRKQGCVATEGQAGAWDCYYNLVFDPMPGRTYNRLNGKGRFRRNSKAWTYEELSAMPDTRPLTTNR